MERNQAGSSWVNKAIVFSLSICLASVVSGGLLGLVGANRVRNIFWLWLMLVFAVAMIAFTVILFANVGVFPLPAAVGLLASSLVLLKTVHVQDAPHSGRIV